MPARTQASTDITHTTLSVIVLVFLVALTVLVISPFLTAMLWAAIVSVATWPFLLRLQAIAGGRRGLAVAIVSVATLLVVFVPVTLALATIVRNAQNLTEDIKTLESIVLPAPPAVLEDVPFGGLGGRRIAREWRRVAAMSPEERSAALAPYVERALHWFAATAGSVGSMLLQFVLTTIITAFVLARGETVRDGILRFARRLAGQQGYDAAIGAAHAIRGVVLGVVVTALMQSAIGGAGLAISGIPAAPLLAAVMLFLCLAQLGPLPVLAPAVIWLYWSGQSGLGTLLLVIGVVALGLDNVVRPLLIRRGASLPLLLIFTGVIGGLIAMGIIGLFIGPAVLTVVHTLLVKWVADDDAAAPGEVAAGKAIARRAG